MVFTLKRRIPNIWAYEPFKVKPRHHPRDLPILREVRQSKQLSWQNMFHILSCPVPYIVLSCIPRFDGQISIQYKFFRKTRFLILTEQQCIKTDGQCTAWYSKLIFNISTRTQPLISNPWNCYSLHGSQSIRLLFTYYKIMWIYQKWNDELPAKDSTEIYSKVLWAFILIEAKNGNINCCFWSCMLT